jgi:hypothetical protein
VAWFSVLSRGYTIKPDPLVPRAESKDGKTR